MGHSTFIPRAVATLMCPNPTKGKTHPLLVYKCKSTLSEFPKMTGNVRTRVVPRIGAGQEKS